jgi:hypothetical protein
MSLLFLLFAAEAATFAVLWHNQSPDAPDRSAGEPPDPSPARSSRKRDSTVSSVMAASSASERRKFLR